MKRKLTVALAAAAVAVLPVSGAMADSHLGSLQVITQTIDVPAADDAAQVVVVHGVPDLEVDILVDGAAAIEGFNFTDIAVVDLPAGDYDLAVASAGSTDPVLGPASVSLEAGVSYSVVAHLDADGGPTVTIEANTTDEGAGIQVFHTAAFGAVDILAGGDAALEGVTNGQTAFIATGAATVPGVGVAAAGTGEAAIDLGDVTVPEGISILAYAVGALPDAADDDADSDDAAEDEVDQPEGGVAAGSAGLAAGMPLWATSLMVLGALGLAAPAVATARRRS